MTVRPASTKTLNGTQNFDRMVKLKGMLLPEFSRSKKINEMFVCNVSKEDTNIDVILGNDFLQAIDINCDGTNITINWINTTVLYKPRDYLYMKYQMYLDFLESMSLKKLSMMTWNMKQISHRF